MNIVLVVCIANCGVSDRLEAYKPSQARCLTSGRMSDC
jgi:hypothetical protein